MTTRVPLTSTRLSRPGAWKNEVLKVRSPWRMSWRWAPPAHAAAAAASVLAVCAVAFAAVKYAGVAYLLFMAWNALNERGSLAIDKAPTRRSDLRVVADAVANGGPMIKRWRPRAQGRAFPIHKPMTHITVVVADREA